MEGQKLYKVRFTVRAYCNGVYSFLPGHLTVLAESREAAIKKVANSDLGYFKTDAVQEIDLKNI